ncbi:hypothetical protein [uncultured Mediterranean phage uvMED]|nr:hypothetical protein [uncultured Mediterranean phage uvMED]
MKKKFQTPSNFNKNDRARMGELIIDHIRRQTSRGRNPETNKSFGSYSKGYAESKKFKQAGKSKNKVNLRLTGEMIQGLQIVSNKEGGVTLGFLEERLSDRANYNLEKDNRDVLAISDSKLERIITQVEGEKVETQFKKIIKIDDFEIEDLKPEITKDATKVGLSFDSILKQLGG